MQVVQKVLVLNSCESSTLDTPGSITITMKFLVLLLALFGIAAASPFARTLTKQFPERIVGGVEAGKGDFPFMVEIRRTGHYCGGSIVNDEWIVTAAHCSVATIAGYTVVAGEHNLIVDEGSEQRRTVVTIVNHPSYNENTFANDISVWRMSTPWTFNGWVQPANLAQSWFECPDNADVAGWGALSSGGGSPNVLMRVNVPVVNDARCKASYGNQILPGMVCAGEGGKDSCQGDSGGPMLCGNSNTVYGIVSWGYLCAEPNYPGVYTDIAYFANWVQQNTQ